MVNVFPVSPESCSPPLYHVMAGAGSPDTSHVSENSSTAETTWSTRGELKAGGVPVEGGVVGMAVSSQSKHELFSNCP